MEDESTEATPPTTTTNSGKSTSSSSKSERNDGSGVNKESEICCSSEENNTPAKEVKELLLCLRPIRDGEKKVDESLRFTPAIDRMTTTDSGYETTAISTNDDDPVNVKQSVMSKHRPPKKRFQHSLNSGPSSSQVDSPPRPACASDAEKSVVESLILMSSEKN
jgi:hypothetical protein